MSEEERRDDEDRVTEEALRDKREKGERASGGDLSALLSLIAHRLSDEMSEEERRDDD